MCECLSFSFLFLLFTVPCYKACLVFENSILLGVSRFILGFPLWDGMSFQLPFFFFFLFFFGWLADRGGDAEGELGQEKVAT